LATEFIDGSFVKAHQHSSGAASSDNEAIRALIYAKGANPIIPRKNNSTVGNADMDWDLYKSRHLVENLFARLKHFRAIATRYDKLQQNFKSIVALACGFLWLTA
jgi:transposase